MKHVSSATFLNILDKCYVDQDESSEYSDSKMIDECLLSTTATVTTQVNKVVFNMKENSYVLISATPRFLR